VMLTGVMLSCTAHIHKIVPIYIFYQNVRGLRTKKVEFHDSVSCTEDNVIQSYVYWTVRHIDG
jgi:hypothetical protein